jgi:hypothetical protein
VFRGVSIYVTTYLPRHLLTHSLLSFLSVVRRISADDRGLLPPGLGIPMPLLDPLFLPPQLLLALLVGHEIVLMLGRNLQIDLRLGLFLQVHHNFD